MNAEFFPLLPGTAAAGGVEVAPPLVSVFVLIPGGGGGAIPLSASGGDSVCEKAEPDKGLSLSSIGDEFRVQS